MIYSLTSVEAGTPTFPHKICQAHIFRYMFFFFLPSIITSVPILEKKPCLLIVYYHYFTYQVASLHILLRITYNGMSNNKEEKKTPFNQVSGLQST